MGWALALLTTSCVGGESVAKPTTSMNTPRDPAALRAASASCASMSEVPELTSYVTATIPGTYRIRMRFEGHEWLPAHTPDMPRHHASRLELSNESDFGDVLANHDRDLVFLVRLDSSSVKEVPGHRLWRAIYFATILAVCEAPKEAP